MSFDQNTWSARLLLGRLISTCKSFEGDASEAEKYFTAFYSKLFGPVVPSPFFSQTTITCQDVIDLIILVAVNCAALDESAYVLIRSAAFLLVCNNNLQGTRLMHAMEMHGFVHSDDYAKAAESMRNKVREPTVWESMKNYIDQLCTTVNWPNERIIAGVYNNLIDSCSMPKSPMAKAVLKDVRKLVDTYYAKAKYRERIKKYIAENVSGTQRRNVKVGDDTVSILFTDVSDLNVRKPIFQSAEACINFALNCAEDIFLDRSLRKPTTWYTKQFLIVRDTVRKQAAVFTTTAAAATETMAKKTSNETVIQQEDEGTKRAETGNISTPQQQLSQAVGEAQLHGSWISAITDSVSGL